MKRILFEDAKLLRNCAYIVLGEENHEIFIRGNGYILGDIKPGSSKGILTVGRVFELLPEDKEFTAAHPRWRDNCLSFALAKILRCRFAKLSLDEADCKKNLDFVLEGLIDYIGQNCDNQTGGGSEERNPIESVFQVIQDELNFVADFLHLALPLEYFFPFYYFNGQMYVFVLLGGILMGVIIFMPWIVRKLAPALLYYFIVEQDENRRCFFRTVRGHVLTKIFSVLDQTATILLWTACFYLHLKAPGNYGAWSNLQAVKEHIYGPGKRYQFYKMLCQFKIPVIRRKRKVKQSHVDYPTVLNMRREKIFFCVCLNWSAILRIPKWARRKISKATPTVLQPSIDSKGAILMFLTNSKGQLTNGKTSLNKHDMEHLNWACMLHNSTTEVILIWHIATTLFHHPHLNPANQERSHPKIDNPLTKQQKVALELSSYCHYLVAYRPVLLPDKLECTQDVYEGVRKDLLNVDKFSDKNSVIGKGAKLAKDLKECAEKGAQVWEMLADFWAETMLFIAPSDNVEGHQEILRRGELITQLWALLTHAGILSRPKQHHNRESGNNSENIGDLNV